MRLLRTNSNNTQLQGEVFSLPAYSSKSSVGLNSISPGVASYYFQRPAIHGPPPRRSSSLVRRSHNQTNILSHNRSYDAESLLISGGAAGVEKLTVSLRRAHASRVETASSRRAGGFDRTGSQPPPNLDNLTEVEQSRTISNSFSSLQVIILLKIHIVMLGCNL